MAARALHPETVILDAARALVLDGGPRAATTAAIAQASGAPTGSLYHRFGSRDDLLAAVWMRSIERLRDGWLAAASGLAAAGDPIERGVAMALGVLHAARAHPSDARLVGSLRLPDLLGGAVSAEVAASLESVNLPVMEELRGLARSLRGRAGAADVERVRLAVIDLPHGVVRSRLKSDGLPGWLDEPTAAAVRAALGVITTRATEATA